MMWREKEREREAERRLNERERNTQRISDIADITHGNKITPGKSTRGARK